MASEISQCAFLGPTLVIIYINHMYLPGTVDFSEETFR